MAGIDLTGKHALVTGGAQGLGLSMATALAVAGAKVAIGDIQDEAGKVAAAELGEGYVFVHLDVTDDASWEVAVASTVELLGGFDILINDAGVEFTSLLINVKSEQVRTMNDVNILGVTLGLKHAFRAMKPDGVAGNGGAVVNIASVAATIAFPAIANYSATKSAIDRLTRVGAAEAGVLGYDVRVNCVYPGLVSNAMGQRLAGDVADLDLFPSAKVAVDSVIAQTPLGRLGTQGEMADAVVFLASDAARFITGTGLAVDGGMGN